MECITHPSTSHSSGGGEGGGGREGRSKQPAYTPAPTTRGDEGEERRGMEMAHNGWLCLWAGDGLQQQPCGGLRASVPPHPPFLTPHTQRGKEGAERGLGYCLVCVSPFFRGEVKTDTCMRGWGQRIDPQAGAGKGGDGKAPLPAPGGTKIVIAAYPPFCRNTELGDKPRETGWGGNGRGVTAGSERGGGRKGGGGPPPPSRAPLWGEAASPPTGTQTAAPLS